MKKTYSLYIKEQVNKELLTYPPKIFKQVVSKILSLQKNPRPQDCKALKGIPGAYRTGQGEYRIIYIVKDKEKHIEIFLVGHRGEIYRGL